MRLLTFLLLLGFACGASAQDLAVYDDALRNGFLPDYSYGGGTELAHATTTRNGSAASIGFTGNNSNAVAFPKDEAGFTSTAQYAGVRFFVHGGTVGGQQLRFQLYDNLGGLPVVNVELDSFIAGGAIAANEWRQVEVRFADAPLAFAGSFDRFDLQSDDPDTQPTVYFDDIRLIAASTHIFADSFEGGGVPGPIGEVRFVNTVGNVSQTVAESVGLVTYQVERVNGSSGVVTVDLQIAAGGTAVAPGDYTLTTLTASWANGESGVRNVTLTVVDDPNDESNEIANLQLGSIAGGPSIGAPSTATLTITDNDPAPATPSFSIDDVTVVEGNAGLTPFAFTVTRSGALSGTDTVQVQTADQSATGGSDYVALALTTLTFTPGVTTQAATANVRGDTALEPNETFLGNLSNPSSGTITDAQGVGTIQNDDAAPVPGQLRFSATAYSVGEAEGSATITVRRVGGDDGAVSVTYATSDAMAIAPGDYTTTSGVLMWGDNDAADKTFQVLVSSDSVPETDETLGLTLSDPIGSTLAMPSTATLTIVEPELLFVPQFTQGGTGSIKVYRRGAADFALINTATLPANSNPNALAFAPDGKLWVVDGGNPNRLLRYSSQAVATLANPVAEAIITPTGNATGDYFDLAFFGDFAYVSQSDFGGTNRILKLALANLVVSGSPVPTFLNNANLSVPAGLEFDAQGRLWVSNFSGQRLVRMNIDSGVADRVGNSVGLPTRASMSNPEGLAFDTEGALWVGNNGAPTLAGYSAAQLDAPGFNAIAPAQFIDIEPGVTNPNAPPHGPIVPAHTGFVGGVAFDRDGDLWTNYQRAFRVLEYEDPVTPGQTLANATTDPGFGGLAFWPVPATMQRGMPGAAPAAQFRGTNLVGMEFNYAFFTAATGPVPGSNYVVHDTRLIDYFAGKGITTLRFLFSWEGMQNTLMGPIPASNVANNNYKLYFDDYKDIVDYATNVRGMHVVIEPWQANMGGGAGGPRWRGNLVGSAQVPTAAWSDFWTKFATLFAANPRVSFGLVNEPNQMSTMGWWAIAQAGVTAIRASGATQTIYVPGNGYSAASTWTSGNYFNDPDAVKRSNAYGWLNANGVGLPITDPLNNMVAEVHTYLDPDEGGSTTGITSVTAARQHMAGVIGEARLRGYKVYLGELGFLATEPLAPSAWADFIAYFEANPDVFVGWSWFAGGDPLYWKDIGANGGGHFAISPHCAAVNGTCPAVTPGCAEVTNSCPALFTGDTVNMDMIENDF